LVKSGRLRLVSAESPWRGTIAGRDVIVGGSSYRQDIPKQFGAVAAGGESASPLVVWLAHHDILIPGYDEGRLKPREIAGIDVVVNGHIHRRLCDVQVGRTLWLTPGNISRRSRSDASRQHVPSVLRIDVLPDNYRLEYVELPHRPFDEVFHEAILETSNDAGPSEFIAGLAELQSRRTASGAGLMEFLDHHLGQFQPAVADEIRNLASEVMHDTKN
jgi:hypothetical protein